MDFEDHLDLPSSFHDSLPNSNSTRSKPLPTPSQPPPHRTFRYKECLKNHAVGISGHAVDGCGEFIPSGDDGTLESLKCAACNCHRNFHRKEIYGGGCANSNFAFYPHPHQAQAQFLSHHPVHGNRGPTGYLHVAATGTQRTPNSTPLLALPSSSGGGGDEIEEYYRGGDGRKKRFRTKFTAEQKDKMLNFAVRLDWKIQKQEEESVEEFCREIGIKRQVLKVWMHNNKHTLGKKP